jgi:type I restriction enzyme S subunit
MSMRIRGIGTIGLANVRTPRVSAEDIGDIRVEVPSVGVQIAIADYLDAETARIDALIETKHRLVDVLRERRSSLITRAITEGLGRDVVFRKTGVPWLGEIPTHWQVLPVKRVGHATIGLTYSPEDLVSEDDQGTLVLRAGNIRDGRVVASGDDVYVSSPIPPSLRLVEGDLLICARSGSAQLVGKNAPIAAEFVGQTWGAFMTVLRSSINEYLRWVLSSSIFNQQVGLFTTSTINQLTSGVLHDMQVPVPPRDEQRQISEWLEVKTAHIDALTAKLEESIVLAKERRTALVSAAVLRQLDILGAAA